MAVSLVAEYRLFSNVTVIRQLDPRCIGFGSFILGADLVQIAFYFINKVRKGKKIRGISCRLKTGFSTFDFSNIL
ncbi:MAG: hypothetical protein JNJ93_09795 [Acinetobacter sp.]|nr:hypothetical protein [Acinetobacter sp.]